MIFSKNKAKADNVSDMFSVGAHYGYDRSRRHPSVLKYIFGRKNNVEIFDLEKVSDKLAAAKEFVAGVAKNKKQILFIGGKREAQNIIREAADKIDMPYVDGRWIGGTLTNFSEIRKRVEHYLKLVAEKEKGELVKYKKRERLMIEKEIVKLEERFGGIANMAQKPAAVFIIDADREEIARDEALQNNIPVVSLSSSDCNFGKIDYVIPGNDSSVDSIKYFTQEIVDAYTEGLKNAEAAPAAEPKKA